MTAISVADLVDRYITLYRDHAADLGPIERFYTSWTDEAQGIQWQVQEETGAERPLYDALKALYVEWLDEKTSEQRAEQFAYNELLQGDMQDVILAEDLEKSYT